MASKEIAYKKPKEVDAMYDPQVVENAQRN